MIKRTRQDMLGMTIMAHNGDCDCGACRYADAMHQLAIADAEIAALHGLVKDIVDCHADPDSSDYCRLPDGAPCQWCENAMALGIKPYNHPQETGE